MKSQWSEGPPCGLGCYWWYSSSPHHWLELFNLGWVPLLDWWPLKYKLMGAGSLSIAEPQRLVMNELMNKWKKPGTFHLKILELLNIHSTRSLLYFVLLHWTLLDLNFYCQTFRKQTVPFLICCCEGKNNFQSHLWIKNPRNSTYNSKSWEKFMGSNTEHIGSCCLPKKNKRSFTCFIEHTVTCTSRKAMFEVTQIYHV